MTAVTADRHFASLVQRALEHTPDINEAIEAARVAFELDLDEGGVHFADPPQRTATGNQPAKLGKSAEPIRPKAPQRPAGPQPQNPTIKSRNEPPPVRQTAAPQKPKDPQPVNPTVKPISSPPPVRRPTLKAPPSGQAEPVDRPKAKKPSTKPRNIVNKGGDLFDADTGENVGHVGDPRPKPPVKSTLRTSSSLAKRLSPPGPPEATTPPAAQQPTSAPAQLPANASSLAGRLAKGVAPPGPSSLSDRTPKPKAPPPSSLVPNFVRQLNAKPIAGQPEPISMPPLGRRPFSRPESVKVEATTPLVDAPHVVPVRKPTQPVPPVAPPAAPEPVADTPIIVDPRSPAGPPADTPAIVSVPRNPLPTPGRTPTGNQPARLVRPTAGQPEPVSIPVKVSPIISKPAASPRTVTGNQPAKIAPPAAAPPKRKTAIVQAGRAENLMRRPDGSAIDPVTQKQVIPPVAVQPPPAGQPEPVSRPAPSKPIAPNDVSITGVDPQTGAVVDPALNRAYEAQQRQLKLQQQAQSSQQDINEVYRSTSSQLSKWLDTSENQGRTLAQILNDPKLAQRLAPLSYDLRVRLRKFIEDQYANRQAHHKATGQFSLDASLGQWITVGADEGEDGEDHGGSPVFVDGGVITKGAPDLKGKRLRGGPSKESQIDKTAARSRVDRNELRSTVEKIQTTHNEHVRSRRKLFAEAYELSKRLGYGGLRGLRRLAARGGDADAVRGLDDIAMILAANHPEHFKDAEDNADRLFEILSHGPPKPMTREEAIEKALKELQTIEDAPFSHDIENKQAQGILNKAIKAANKLTAEARREIKEALDLKDPITSASRIVSAISRHRLQVSKLLSKTQLAALLEGAREVAKHLPPVPPAGTEIPPPASMSFEDAQLLIEEMRDMPFWEREEALYKLPPDQQAFVQRYLVAGDEKPPERDTFAPEAPSEDDPGNTVFPIIDKAVKDLASRNVVTKQTYDRLDAATREKAFAVSGIDAKETLEKVRDAIAKNVAEGVDFRSFQSDVMKELDAGSMISDGHLELVFRNNIQSAFSDGQMGVLSHPFVRSGFPYAAYHAIDDDRVRHNHLALESHGIGKTNIYRIDDPVFRTFRPPWDYCDRCSWTPLTVQQAAAQSCPEAARWLESGTEPSPPAFVPHPPFEPPPGFRRRLESLPAAAQLSLQPLSAFRGVFQ